MATTLLFLFLRSQFMYKTCLDDRLIAIDWIAEWMIYRIRMEASY